MAVRQLTPLRIVPNRVASYDPNARASVEIYRPFFLAGILSVLTAGCALGAVALFGIAMKASYTASAWTPYVLAHANSQLYGWVGFFVMGFALQMHPPRVVKEKLFHRLAYWSLGLMAAGIALRFVAEPMVHVDSATWVPVGVFSCALQTIAVAIFMINTAVTRYRTGGGLTWQTKFVFASLGWWLVVAVAEPFYFALSHQADPQTSILFVAKWFPPYREAQFLGFVTMMIFGVAFVKMNSCFGAKPASQEAGNLAFILWNAGLIARMAGWVQYFNSEMSAGSLWLYYLGGVVLASAGFQLVFASRLFEQLEFDIPSHKFVRGAMTWLLIAGLMLLAEPFHLRAIGRDFSHAYIGAIRHAITVGFISQMILGVGLHVVSRMNDLENHQIPKLWTVFWLVNIGNTARVALEVGTDYTPAAFGPMGFTGFIELTGLVIWAVAVARPMLRSRRLANA